MVFYGPYMGIGLEIMSVGFRKFEYVNLLIDM